MILFLLICMAIMCLMGGVFVIVLMFKNDNTCKNRLKILEAIYEYQITYINNNTAIGGLKVIANDIEDYDKTFWRLWDWGYTRILPKDKFEIIKPYIK